MRRSSNDGTKRARTLEGAGALAVLSAGLAGCPSSALYATARTLAPGRHQHTIGVEGIAPVVVEPSSGAVGATFSPNVPTYQARVGLHERVELGVRVPNLSSLGADVKVALVRGRVDVAVMPSVQGAYFAVNVFGPATGAGSSGGFLYASAPVLVGVNASRRVSVVGHLGPALAYVGGTTTGMAGTASYVGVTNGAAFALRYGVGVNLRITDFVALHPEVSAFTAFGANGVASIITPVIGLQLGASPDFSDLEESGASQSPAPPPSP
jgi:hypothetical protein